MDLLNGLNEQQREAVATPAEMPALVLAGAGCGKTTVLIRRIAWLLHHGYPAQGILALTFTRLAAREMSERAHALTAGPDGDAPMVTTFHGLGNRFLLDSVEGEPNYRRLGYATRPRLLEDREILQWLAELSSTRERRFLGVNLLGLAALLEKSRVRPEPAVDERLLPVLSGIAARIQECKRREGAWDFGDMLLGMTELLETRPGLRRRFQQRYRAVLVDEFQDTNPLQVRLLHLLLDSDTHLYAVGDDDQAIYAFRGADTGPILQFAKHFPGARVHKLETNYRSTARILQAANRIFREKPEPVRKVLRCGKKGPRGSRVCRHACANQDDMMAWICRRAGRISRSSGIPCHRMAVLFRVNETLGQARRYLESSPGTPELALLTVHGSKGLEFPVVFLCDLEETIFPSYRKPRGRQGSSLLAGFRQLLPRSAPHVPPDCNLEEERRLFYVGVTRAQQQLFLISCRYKTSRGVARPYTPSRFLHLI